MRKMLRRNSVRQSGRQRSWQQRGPDYGMPTSPHVCTLTLPSVDVGCQLDFDRVLRERPVLGKHPRFKWMYSSVIAAVYTARSRYM